eukprot:5663651-Pyramimonas_sp.AAC.1
MARGMCADEGGWTRGRIEKRAGHDIWRDTMAPAMRPTPACSTPSWPPLTREWNLIGVSCPLWTSGGI